MRTRLPLGIINARNMQVFLEQLEGELESENPWERVVSLVDTQTEIVEDFKDTSRMTSILIQLKNEPLDVSLLYQASGLDFGFELAVAS